ncbi:hypothetical protein [Natronomonas sp.]|uniref:DUF7519 family protein n=1 Tax=Natronomonas sp. TaxID=2184060 RepID=UPI00397545E0
MTDRSPPSPFVRLPTITSSALGIVAAALAVGLIAETETQRGILAIAVLGAAVFVLGGRLWHRGRRVIGVVSALCGVAVLAVAVIDAAARPSQIVDRLELLPGIAGLWVLAVALAPLRIRWSRTLIDAGTGLVFLGVLTSGVVRGAPPPSLVAAGAATILAWDVTEYAVSVGGQVGARHVVATARGELVHASLSLIVAGVAAAAVLGVDRLGIDGLSFAALLALVVAGVALSLVYHR